MQLLHQLLRVWSQDLNEQMVWFPTVLTLGLQWKVGNRHPAMRRGYQGTTEKAGQGPGWEAQCLQQLPPPHNSPNTSSFLCLPFGTKDLKRVVPTHVFPMSSLSIHFSASTRTLILAIFATKMALGTGDLRLSADTAPPSLPYTSFSIREGQPLLVS